MDPAGNFLGNGNVLYLNMGGGTIQKFILLYNTLKICFPYYVQIIL